MSVKQKTTGKRGRSVFSHDLRKLSQSGVALVLVISLLLVPAFFAWINIFGSWNPYIEESTANIPIALACDDRGLDVMGVNLSIGSIVLDKLSESKVLGWQLKNSRDEAVTAVNSGACYAAVIIPSDFTARFLSVVEGEDALIHPTLEFYQNSKINGVVNSLLIKGRNTIRDQVNSSLIGTISGIVDKVFSLFAASGIEPDRIGETLALKVRGLTETIDQLLLVMEALQQLGSDGTDLLSGAAETIYTLGDVLGSGGATIAQADKALNATAGLLDESLGGVSLLLKDLSTTLDSVLKLGSSDANPFPRVSSTLTRYISNIQLMRLQNVNDPLFCAAADEVLAHLNAAQTIATQAAYPDVGGGSQTRIEAELDAATAAIQNAVSQSAVYSGAIQTHQQAVSSLADTIDALTPGLLGYETFLFNRQGYLSTIQDISSKLSVLAESFPYSSYPQTVAKLGEARTQLVSSVDKMNAVIDLASFIVGKDSIETALSSAAAAIGDAAASFEATGAALSELEKQVKYAVSGAKTQFNGNPELTDLMLRLSDDVAKLSSDMTIPVISDTFQKVADAIALMTGLYGTLDLGDNLNQFIAAGQRAQNDLESCTYLLSDRISGEVAQLLSQLRSTLYTVQGMLSGGATTSYSLSKVLGEYANAMGNTNTTLDMATELLERLDGFMTGLANDLETITTTEAYQKLMEVVRNNPDAIAEYLVTPVPQQDVLIHHSENYGSSMAPYYIMFALYVGALLLPAFIKVNVSDDKLLRLSALRRYLGRYMIFLFIALGQALLTGLGCLYFVGIQCYDPLKFLLACMVCSLSFSMINYSLVYGLGVAGLGISAMMMIVQVAGADGTYPIDVIPDIFQKLYDYMPFRYGMDMLRETICGSYGRIYERGFMVHIGLFVGFAILGFILHFIFKGIVRKLSDDMDSSGVFKAL